MHNNSPEKDITNASESAQSNVSDNNTAKPNKANKAKRDFEQKTQSAITSDNSAFKKYKQVIVGSDSLGYTLYFEFCTWLSIVPGALGLMLRKLFWPRLFHSCGRGSMFAKGVILRHPRRMVIGDNVIVSEGVILDARNDSSDTALTLGDNVIISNNVCINCKEAKVKLGKNCGVGPQTIIQALGDCDVIIGDDVVIGPQCYIVGGGSYHYSDTTKPIWKQGNVDDGGTVIENDVWLGSQVSVLGGVTVATGSIIAANATVNKSCNKGDILAGVPAKAIKNRLAND